MQQVIFDDMQQALMRLEAERLLDLVHQGLQDGIPPLKMVEEGITAGMRRMGELFEAGEIYIPHLMVAAEAMEKCMATIEPHLVRGEEDERSLVAVIGTVAGDIHDLGKNLVSTMLRVSGVKVWDLGRDVGVETFVEKARELEPDYVLLSALMTTTMTVQQEVIEALRQAGIRDRVQVLVGGAPVTQQWAERIGADGHGKDAMQAVRIITGQAQ